MQVHVKMGLVALLAGSVAVTYLCSFASKSFTQFFFSPPDQQKEISRVPKIRHVVLDESVVQGKRVFLIGDVHGCYDEMMELLHKADALRDDTVVIFVGDMVNKGPKSWEVLDFLRRSKVYAVKGNHEDHVLREYDKSKDPGYKLPPKYTWVGKLTSEEAEYLRELPYTISLPTYNVIVVHAGLVPGRPLEEQSNYEMMTMRNVVKTADGFEARKRATEGQPWAAEWTGPQHIVFGHDAVRRLQLYDHATGLDTGCLYGGNLTGLFLLGKERKFVSVKSRQSYINAVKVNQF
ncbi:bis(5'-nucleosyl)-tetraphosphatase PrpE [asymmetrical]-like [Branchiostoma lanceolatum]|uniref:Hypp505 protein n=1 Tax=Branchiostoma lanceolatum TaxID=7740 RepID=A0A8J9WDM8_BRALA|nr:Hypp505 [Branchiostoma lanceolatum]